MATTESSLQTDSLYCPIRKKEVAATPEEKVRASFLKYLFSKEFPQSLILVETPIAELPLMKGLKVPGRRIDILCYTKDLKPLLLIECKAESVPSDALQLLGYNYYIQAPFIALVSKEALEIRSKNGETLHFKEFPSFQQWLLLSVIS